MNKTIMKVATIMIVILAFVLLLIFIGFNQYRETEHVKPKNMHASGEKPSSPIIKNENVIKESGEITLKSGDVFISGENTIDIIDNNSKTTTIDEKVYEEKRNNNPISNKPVETTPQEVITSRNETSNQEKQQVLSEIDDALKGLLDAVGKVQTVDEAKLDASLESEVEP